MAEVYTGTKFNTVFQGDFNPNKKEIELIDQLILAGRVLAKMGFKDNNGGNFSVRTKKGIIIKTTGSFPHKLSRKDFALIVGFKKDNVFAYGLKEPSSEARLHWGIYEARPDVNCVLHTHDFLVVNSKTVFKDVAYIKELPYGTLESARAVKNAAKKYSYLVLENHGVIAISKGVKSTLKLIDKYHEKFKSTQKSST